jgi:hypothetical protein
MSHLLLLQMDLEVKPFLCKGGRTQADADMLILLQYWRI